MEENKENSLSVLEVLDGGLKLDISKASIKDHAERILDKVRDGALDLTQVVVAMKAMEKVSKSIFEDGMIDDVTSVREAMVNLIEREGQKIGSNAYALNKNGIAIETMESGVSYDYSKDPIWSFLHLQIKAREKRLRECAQSDSLRGITSEIDENGVELHRPTKKSTTTFKIGFK